MVDYIVRVMNQKTGEQEREYSESTPAKAMRRERILQEELDLEKFYTQMDEVVE